MTCINITSPRILAGSVIAILFGIAADLNSSVVPVAVTLLLVWSIAWHVQSLHKNI